VRLGFLLPGWAWSAVPRLDGLGHQTQNLVERPRPSYSNKWRDGLKKYSKSETKTLHRTLPTGIRLGQSFFPWNRCAQSHGSGPARASQQHRWTGAMHPRQRFNPLGQEAARTRSGGAGRLPELLLE
jgi:hypothetical protein